MQARASTRLQTDVRARGDERVFGGTAAGGRPMRARTAPVKAAPVPDEPDVVAVELTVVSEQFLHVQPAALAGPADASNNTVASHIPRLLAIRRVR